MNKKKINKLLEITSILPLITYFVIAGSSGFEPPELHLALSVSFPLCLIHTIFSYTQKSLTRIYIAYLVFLSLGFLLMLISPYQLTEIYSLYSPALLYTSLFISTLLPWLFKRGPFSIALAKKKVPEPFWSTSSFININIIISIIWEGIFLTSAFLAFINNDNFLFTFCIPAILMLGLGLPINKYFPSLYPLFQKIGKKLKTNINKGGKKMKIVAFIGSPHKRISNTRELLRWVLEEAESLGAETKIIDILDHKINYCSGCGTCLMNGTCPQTDDMRNLKEIMKESDGIILASPVYFFSVPAQMKTFIDRLLSFGHRPSLSGKYGLSVVVSAGKGEIQVANWLLSILQSFGVNPVGTLSGICITAKNFYDKTALIAQAKHIAQDLVRAWKEKQTFPRNEWNLEFHRFMKELIFYNQEFMRKDFEYWNSHGWFLPEKSLSNINYTDWQKDMKELNQNKSGPASLKKDNLAKCNLKPTRNIPEDITASALIQGMAKAYYPKTLPEKKVIIQFVFPDQNQTHYLEIEGKNCLYYEGEYTAPDLTIITPLKVWADISRGKLSGEQAYLKGKYKCHGDMKYLFKLNEWFEK